MNKKRIIFVISAVLLIALIGGGIGVYANFTDPEEIPSEQMYEVRDSVPKTKVLELHTPTKSSTYTLNSQAFELKNIAQNGTVLKYKETENMSTEVIQDIYLDDNGNKYSYDQKGRLSDFYLENQTRDEQSNIQSETEPLSKKTAIALAEKYAYTLYGDRFDGFELKSYYYNDDTPEHSIVYVKKVGFAIASGCFIDMLPNGDIKNITMAREDYYTEFDHSLLKGITEQDLRDFIVNNPSEEGSRLTENSNYTISDIYIVKENNEFALRIFVESDNNFSAEYLYELK